MKKYGKFLNDYNESLDKLVQNLFEYNPALKPSNIITLSNNDHLEATSVFQIIDSDNKVLCKILISFSALYENVKEIKNEAQHLLHNFVLMDEGLAEFETNCTDKSKLKATYLSNVQFGNVLENLFKVRFFLKYVIEVICSTIQQLGALYEIEKEYINTSKSIHFQSVFHYIADMLVILITFQEILKNASLSHCWQFFKQSIKSVKYNLDTFEQKFDIHSIQGVESTLIDLEQILIGDVFEHLIHSLAIIKVKINPKSLGIFSGHMESYLKTTLADITKCDSDLNENFDAHTVVKITSMAVIYHHLFGNLNKKIFRSILELNLKHPVIVLFGNMLFFSEKFLVQHVESLMKGLERMTPEMNRARQIYLTQRIQSFTKDIKQYMMQVIIWTTDFNRSSEERQHKLNNEETKKQCSLLNQVCVFVQKFDLKVSIIYR